MELDNKIRIDFERTADDFTNAQLPEYPLTLIYLATKDLFTGNLNSIENNWIILVDYQRRLIEATFKRLKREGFNQINKNRKKDLAEISNRWEIGLICLENLANLCVRNLTEILAQRSILYEREGKNEEHLRALKQRNLLISTVNFNFENDERNCLSPTFLKPELTRCNNQTNVPSPYENITNDKLPELTEPVPELPAYGLEYITKIIYELVNGDPAFAFEMWGGLLAYQYILTDLYIEGLNVQPGNQISQFRQIEQETEEALLMRHETISKQLDKMYVSYLSNLRRSLNYLIRIHIDSPARAVPYIERLFQLENFENGLPEDTKFELVNLLFTNKNQAVYQQHFQSILAKLPEAINFSEATLNFSRLLYELENLIKVKPLATASILTRSKNICSSFAESLKIMTGAESELLISIFKSLQEQRNNLREEDLSKDQANLVWSLFYLNKTLRLRRKVAPYEGFHDIYDFYNTIRCHRQILRDPEIFGELQSAIREAYKLGQVLFAEDHLNEKMRSNPRLRGYYYSRLGEICRAYAQFDCGSSESDYTTVLETGIKAFERSLEANDFLNAHDLLFVYPRMGECLGRLRRYDEGIKFYFEVIKLTDKTPTLQTWEAFKYIGVYSHLLAKQLISKDKQTDFECYFQMAKSYFMQAAHVWEPELDISREVATDSRNMMLHAHMAWMYLDWEKYSEAESQARMGIGLIADNTIREHKNYYDLVNYILGVTLIRQDRFSEAIQILENIIQTGIEARYRTKSLLALKDAYLLNGENSKISQINAELLNTSREIMDEDVLSLSQELEQVLADFAEMKEYIKWCEKLLEKGETRALIAELPSLVKVSQRLMRNNRPDPVLLCLLADAYLEAGKYEAALQSSQKALRADGSKKNKGICWLKIGEILLRQNKFAESAEAFETSYINGENISPLLKAAKARTYARDYEQALKHFETIRQSNYDKYPGITATENASTLWHKFKDPRPDIGGNEDDVVKACELCTNALMGKWGFAGDIEAARQLVVMATVHQKARTAIRKLLRKSPAVVQKQLLRMLLQTGIYSESFVITAISVLQKHPLRRGIYSISSPQWSLFNLIAKFVFSAWVNSYITQPREASDFFIRRTINALLEKTTNPIFWSSLLASNKNAMSFHVTEQVFKKLSMILSENRGNKSESHIDYLKNKALPTLYIYLETQLLGLVTPAYGGREATCLMLDEIIKVANSLPVSSGYKKKINTKVSIDRLDHSYPVGEFQGEVVATMINQLAGELVRTVLPSESLKEMALRLEESDNLILVKLRIAVSDSFSPETSHQLLKAIESIPFWEKWKKSTAFLLPKPISVTIRNEHRDLLVCIPLWAAEMPKDEQWKWNQFYSHVVRNSTEKLKDRVYHLKAFEYIKEVLPLNAENLTAYVFAHLDGLFVETYKSSRSLLEAVPHTITSTLAYLSDDSGDVAKSDAAALGVQILYKKFLQISTIHDKEFDLYDLLREVMDDSRIFYPDISFEIPENQNSVAIILGKRGSLVTAIWDIIHNAVKALRNLDDDQPKRIKIVLAHKLDGIEVHISNTGSIESDPNTKSFGIGSKNVEYVVCTQHGGTVSHGPLDESKTFRYQWQIFLPFAPMSKRKR
ncbi:MAG: tetratricopeptide repeat protein [Pyrinomonadaceae bacterium]|nr:tetratricopeptide repeat protein [Pyrinomonadaceae bacterium]